MIYLIGFSGVGKTSVAKKLAKDLNLKYMDTDELIEKKYKASIKKFLKKVERFSDEKLKVIF